MEQPRLSPRRLSFSHISYIPPEKIRSFIDNNDLEGLKNYLKSIRDGKGKVIVNTLFRIYELRNLNPAPQEIGKFISHLEEEIDISIENEYDPKRVDIISEINEKLYSSNANMAFLAMNLSFDS